MLLASSNPDTRFKNEVDFFKYAHALGTFHANVIYVGPGSADYQCQRIKLLWVWWYDIVRMETLGWKNSRMDRLSFPPITWDDALGFVNPSDVLRGCHVTPRFSLGMQHSDWHGISYSGKDSEDW